MTRTSLPLRRLFKIVNGGTPTAEEKNWGGSIPWATPVDIANKSVSVSETQRTLTQIGARSGSSIVPKGSILLSTRAPIGYTAITEVSMAFNQGCRALVPLGEVDVRFFRYQLEAREDDLQAAGMGTTFVELSSGALAGVEVNCPEFEEQRRIADFLDAEAHRINEMQKLISGQMSRMSERRAAVLDSLRVDITEVPMVRLGYKVSLVTSGSRGWASFVGDVGNIFFRSANLSSGSLVPNLKNIVFVDIPDLESAESARSRISPGDVLVGITGANAGWVSLADESVSGGNVSQHVCLVRPRVGEIDGRWLAYLISSPVVQGFLMGSQYGGTKTQLSLPDIRNIRIPSMGVGEQKRAADRVEEEVLEGEFQLKLRRRQIELLEERKRALITAAVTGQIDVTTARGADLS